ncbi:MAG: hypothetical protein O9301_12870 [Leptospira sp.]|nr:hypothetical protein [Leptospira sp.]
MPQGVGVRVPLRAEYLLTKHPLIQERLTRTVFRAKTLRPIGSSDLDKPTWMGGDEENRASVRRHGSGEVEPPSGSEFYGVRFASVPHLTVSDQALRVPLAGDFGKDSCQFVLPHI